MHALPDLRSALHNRRFSQHSIAILCGLLLGLMAVLPVLAAPPNATNLSTSTLEDTAITINVNNPDTNLYELKLAIPSPAHGAVSIVDRTTLHYMPGANETATVTFGYIFCETTPPNTVTCGSIGQITVAITPVNDEPTAVDNTATTNEDTSVTVNVLTNDTPGPNETGNLTVIGIASSPSNGSATFNASQVIYTPNLNFCGTDVMKYRIQDDGGLTSTANVNVTVTCVNDPPLATNDTFTVIEDSTNKTLDVLANDSAGPANENQTKTIVSIQNVTNGTATHNGSVVTYTPTPNFCGTVYFSYNMADDGGSQSVGSVTVNVTCVPETPTLSVVNPVSLGSHTFSVDLLLDSPDVVITAVDFTLGFDSACVEDRDTPANGFAGAGDDDITTAIPTSGTPRFSFLPQDVSGQPQVRFLIASQTNPASILAGAGGPANRVLATIRFRLKPNCPLTLGQYAVDFSFPTAAFFGADTFATPGAAPAVNDLVITANQAPSAVAITPNPGAVPEGIAGATAGTLNTTDSDDTTHTYTLVSGAGSTDNSSFDISGTTLKLKPAMIATFPKTYAVRVRSTDPYGAFVEAPLSVDVTKVNHAPDAINDGILPVIIVTFGTPQVINVLANDTDPDGNTLSVSAVNQGTKGSVTNNTSNITYNATDSNYSGPDSFSYTASDGQAPPLTDNATVSVIVVANDVPGDCNSDGAVNAGDLAAFGLEFFDSDNNSIWYNTYQSTFAGSPKGCDANGNGIIDAGDLVTIICIATGHICPPAVTASNAGTPSLAVSGTLSAGKGETVSVPISIDTAGNSIGAAIFAVAFDDTQLSFDDADADSDGIPDSVSFTLPSGLQAQASYNAAESRVEVVIFDFQLPLEQLTDGTLVTVALKVSDTATVSESAVALTTASLGSSDGQNVPVEVQNNTITIEDQPTGQREIELFLPAIMR